MAFSRYSAYFVSEFICTGLLVACACLARSALEDAVIPTSIAYGLLNLVLTNCFGPFSGGYANPAVVLALWWRQCMPIKRFIVYVTAEITGAAAGHYAINCLLGKSPTDPMCFITQKAGMDDKNLMGAEFLITFLLVMTWCVLWDYEGELPMEWYLAGVNALTHLLGAFLTGGSANPARTIAPMFFVKKTHSAQLCLAGQLVAGIAAPSLWACLQFWTKS